MGVDFKNGRTSFVVWQAITSFLGFFGKKMLDDKVGLLEKMFKIYFLHILLTDQLGQSAVLPSKTTKSQMPFTRTTSRLTKQSVRVQHTTNRKSVQTTKLSVLKTSTTRRTSSPTTVYLSTTKTAAVQTSSLKPRTGTNTTTPSQSSNKSKKPKPTNKSSFGHSVSTKATQKSKQSSVQQQSGKKSTSTKATVKSQNGGGKVEVLCNAIVIKIDLSIQQRKLYCVTHVL